MAENAEAMTKPMIAERIPVQKRLACGNNSVKGSTPQNRPPDHVFGTDAIADGSAEERTCSRGAQKHEQMQLRAAHRHAEAADEVEGVVAGEAGEIEILGEDEC